MPNAVTRQIAVMRLTNRWMEQCEKFPTMRRDIPLTLYLRVNASHVMRHGLLQEYDHA